MPDAPAQRASTERGFATGLGAVVVGLLAVLAAIAIAGFGAAGPEPLRGAVLVLAGALLFALFALGYVTLALADALEALDRAGIPVRRRLGRAAPAAAGPTITRREAVPPADPRVGPFGHVHNVIDIEGIGPTRAAKLKALGIESTKELWFADAADVAASLKVGVPMVRQWQQMGELMALDGIGKQFAELLVRSGVTGIDDLRGCEAQDLFDRTVKAGEDLTHRIQGAPVNVKLVEGWIEAARSHAPVGERFMSDKPPWAKPPA